jgi:hypothetical protein
MLHRRGSVGGSPQVELFPSDVSLALPSLRILLQKTSERTDRFSFSRRSPDEAKPNQRELWHWPV